MTVANTNVSSIFNANGVTREWNLDFHYNPTLSGLYIYVRHADGTSTDVVTNYELDGNVLTYPTVESELDPLPTGEKLVVERVTPITQSINLTQQGPLDAETLESGYDKDILVSQEINDKMSRAIIFPSDVEGETDAQTFITELEGLVSEAEAQVDLATEEVVRASKWAEGTDEEVVPLGGEKSAKGWANAASSSATSASASATSASTSATNAEIWAEGTDQQVTPLGGEHSAKGWADVAEGWIKVIFRDWTED